jgi:hypothetical protein
MVSILQKTAKTLAQWQKYIVTKHKMDDGTDIPHPAAAPISTDQEAGGTCSTPEGERLHGDSDNKKPE